MTVPPIITVPPGLVPLAERVVRTVDEVRVLARQADPEPAARAAVRTDDLLADVIAEATTLRTRVRTRRNKLQYDFSHAAKRDRKAPWVGSLKAELAIAEADVAQVEQFLAYARACWDEIQHIVAVLRHRYERAEGLAALARLDDRLREHLAGVAQLIEQANRFTQATAEPGPEMTGMLPYDRLRPANLPAFTTRTQVRTRNRGRPFVVMSGLGALVFAMLGVATNIATEHLPERGWLHDPAIIWTAFGVLTAAAMIVAAVASWLERGYK
jgi:hypothetical protein